MRARCSFLVCWVVALVLSLAGPRSALAQSEDDLVRARQLYAQGLTQEAAGDWTGALATFEQVARIKLTPQVRFHIARTKEHLGRLNEALGGYRLAEYEAERGTPKEQEILGEVRTAREALEKRIPKLTIVRGEHAQAIKIELDGVVLGAARIGAEITVDPGPHVVTGVVGSGKSFSQDITIGEGEQQKVVLDVPESLRAEASRPGTAPAPPPAPATPADRPAPAPAKKSSSAAPWIVGGLGVATLIASGVFYALRSSEEKKLEDGCLGRTCPDSLRDSQSRGETYAAASGVLLGVGLAGVGASALMLLGRSSEPEPAQGASRAHFGLSYSGRF